jgi:hypothetical protein
MIDSLNLDFGSNFRVNDPDLIVTSNRCSYGEGFSIHDAHLWTDPVKGIVTGKGAYFRHNDEFPFDISYRKWSDGKMHFMIMMSVPKLLDGINLRIISQDEFLTTMNILQEKLGCLGIYIDPMQGRIVRIDLFKQGQMISDFSTYTNLLSQFRIPRADLRQTNTSLLWKNRLEDDWAINVYDKGIQMKSKDPSHALLRIEVQLRRWNISKRVLGFDSVEELTASFEQLPKVYERFLERRFLLNNETLVSPDSMVIQSAYSALIADHQQNSGVRWRSTSLEDIGIIAFCNSVGIDTAIAMLTGTGKNASTTERSRRSRFISRMREVLLKQSIALENPTSTHTANMKDCFEHIKEIIRPS